MIAVRGAPISRSINPSSLLPASLSDHMERLAVLRYSNFSVESLIYLAKSENAPAGDFR